MRHQLYNPSFSFVKEPVTFDRSTDRELLQYCLGGVLYMPGTKDFRQALLSSKIPGLTSIVMCFEDAVPEEDVPAAEQNVTGFLHFCADSLENGALSPDNMPLIFLRVRSIDQFDSIISKLDKRCAGVLSGFVFPKFNQKNGIAYFSRVAGLRKEYGEPLYGMPILEGKEIAYKESRFAELMAVKTIIDSYRELVLNVRVGGTDFSSCFGVRRGIDYTIYDIMPVCDCLLDILNVFARENSYVLSGPVWEYFLAQKEKKFEPVPVEKFQHSLLSYTPIVNKAVDGLLREVILDKANGFVGKTCIHPTHIPFINGLQAVTEDEYNDAVQILGKTGGVVKSSGIGKMNEVKPHTSWAQKISMKAQAYGVVANEDSYVELFEGVFK